MTEGLVIVGGHSLDDARLVVNVLVGAIAAHQAGTMVLVSTDASYRPDEGHGVVLRARPSGLGAALRTFGADWVAVGPGLPPGEVSIEDLEPTPRVLAGVVAPDAASLVPRWLARLARGPEHAAIYLATTPIVLIMAEHDGGGDDAIFLTAWKLDPRERALALEGKTEALAESLARPRGGKQRLQLHSS
jgi:hypothetical protein